MHTSYLIGALALLSVLASTLDGAADNSKLPDTSQTLEDLRKKHDLPALAVVVVKDGQIRDRAAVGVRKLGDSTPASTNDVFHIGSCTKSMTATLAGMFVEEGKLRWNTTIGEVFPEWKSKMAREYETVTVEQLLTHRGGVPNQPPAAAWREAWQQKGTVVEQRKAFIYAVFREPPEAPPGTQFIYSNQGYAIVGAMLEKLSGETWERLIEERLFEPLGMKSAGFGAPGTTGKVDQPWGHTRKGNTITPVQADNPPAISPAGRVHCSLDDLARYVMIHLKGERDGGLLRPETFRKLHTPPPNADYACGWGVRKRPWAGGRALTHNGSNTMWFVIMWLAPERDFAVIAGTNIAGQDAESGCDEVAGAMIRKWLPN